MIQPILQYSYLQVLDLLTTIAFLIHGIQEGNPLVRLAMKVTPNPIVGLVVVKGLAVALGLVCWLSGRDRALNRINIVFAIVVAWNLSALILGSTKL